MNTKTVGDRDIFEEMIKYVVEHRPKIKDMYRLYGGMRINIPSYKTTFRDEDIKEDSKKGLSEMELSRKYLLSMQHIKKILREDKPKNLLDLMEES